MASPVALILGAGSNVGQQTALAFQAKGYRVALASRSAQDGIDAAGFLRIKADFSKLEDVTRAFGVVKEKLSLVPSVVVYNAYSNTGHSKDDPLSNVTESALTRDFTVSTLGAIIAAKHAVSGFAELPASASKTFIYTGNILNLREYPSLLTFASCKTAAAQAIRNMTVAYGGKGYKFYYADERQKDGEPVYNDIDGPAHGKEYVALASDEKQRPWLYTFVKGVGYKYFESDKQ